MQQTYTGWIPKNILLYWDLHKLGKLNNPRQIYRIHKKIHAIHKASAHLQLCHARLKSHRSPWQHVIHKALAHLQLCYAHLKSHRSPWRYLCRCSLQQQRKDNDAPKELLWKKAMILPRVCKISCERDGDPGKLDARSSGRQHPLRGWHGCDNFAACRGTPPRVLLRPPQHPHETDSHGARTPDKLRRILWHGWNSFSPTTAPPLEQ